MTLFVLNQASLNYGKHSALNDVSLTIDAGEKVALVGPSGAGKTSLLNILFEQQQDHIALCPQHYGLVDILSVYHNIYMGQLENHSALYNLWNLAFPIAAHKTAIGQLSKELGIEDKLFYSVDNLSGGQQQRVSIGRALYRDQPIFLGDEPVASLDPLQGQVILSRIVKSHETVVVALHNRRLALDVFDRVIGIKDGAILLDHPAQELTLNDLDAVYAQ